MTLRDDLFSLVESPQMKSAIQLYRSQPDENAKDRLVKQYAYEQIRRLIAPDALAHFSVDDFNKHILQGGGIIHKGKKYNAWQFWPDYSVNELKTMLENGTAQVVGNCTWGFGVNDVRAYFKRANLSEGEILKHLHDTLQRLQDDAEPIRERLKKAQSVSGLWPNLTTGTLMVLNPDEWIVLNGKSVDALNLLGLTRGLVFKKRQIFTVDNYLTYNELAKQIRDRYGLEHLAEVDAVFNKYVDAGGIGLPPEAGVVGPPSTRLLSSLTDYVAGRGFYFPPELLVTYYLSLQTKPFAILTGISGTGKTKLAQLFAEWMSPAGDDYAFVPVRPDWMDSRGLLGFHNLITGTYSATDFLRLLLRATMNLQSDRPRPYFVILDEMNLAKVEYYFADFLSVIESRRRGESGRTEQECLILHNQPRCILAAGNEGVVDPGYYHEKRFTCLVRCEKCPFASLVNEAYHHDGEFDYDEASAAGFAPQHFVPPRLIVPLNVYFAGTVNVDETTYMFSPKVLDRANTIEFGSVRLDTYFSLANADGARTSTADGETIAAFINNGRFALLPKQVPKLQSDPDLETYREQLVRLNQLLKPFEMHFGYRVADEVLLYLWNAKNLSDPAFDLDTAFDHQLCQKVLPKFHGSQARLQDPLEHLLLFCVDSERQPSMPGAELEPADRQRIRELKSKSVDDLRSHGARHPRAAHKVRRMLDTLEKDGFASFA
jgi:hypothetical protein